MNCQSVRDLLPELLDGRTPATAHAEARAHLAACPDCQRELAALAENARGLDTLPVHAPSARMRQNFQAMLAAEKAQLTAAAPAPRAVQRAERHRSFWALILSPLAGAALLALGFMLGQRTPTASDAATQRELAALREQMNHQRDQLALQNTQLDKMTTLVGYQILQQQQSPASTRLNEVLAAAKAESPSPKVLDDLIQALTLDPNANIRLRAIQALVPHAEREVVRAGVLAALPREQNPLVQLELIDFVATARDTNATPLLERLSLDESADGTVRNAAKLALAQF